MNLNNVCMPKFKNQVTLLVNYSYKCYHKFLKYLLSSVMSLFPLCESGNPFTGRKMKFPICPVDMKFDISLTVLHQSCRG